MNLENKAAKIMAEEIIQAEISAVMKNPLTIKKNGCAACHVLFSIIGKMHVSEQDAADLLSEVLLENSILNDDFVVWLRKYTCDLDSRVVHF